MDTSEVVLPQRARPQPVPHLNPDGDCGPCVLAGLLGWEVREVYERLNDGVVEALGRFDVGAILTGYSDFFERVVVQVPLGWSVPEPLGAFGASAHLQCTAWFTYVRMAVDAGYYGLAQVDHRKGGPLGQGVDHWVLICGARLRGPPPGESGRVWQEVLVSNSSKSGPAEEWVDAHDFLRERGGFNLLLARPAARP